MKEDELRNSDDGQVRHAIEEALENAAGKRLTDLVESIPGPVALRHERLFG